MQKFLRAMTEVLLVIILAIIASFCMSHEAKASELPSNAKLYSMVLFAESRRYWGLNPPLALFGAQIHQESAWKVDAQSKYARSLSQFTPDTASDMNSWYSEHLGSLPTYSPLWAIRALILYDRHLYKAIVPFVAPMPECDHFAMVLVAYNGGPRWLKRDRRMTAANGGNPDLYWGEVELFSARASWAYKENRDYPRRIIYRHQEMYFKQWGGVWVC